MEEALKDERFSHILSDPRFRKMPKRVRKVTLDKRMKKIFKDSSFKGKCELDKRGRLLNLTPTENLKKLYEVSSESSDDDEDDDEGDDIDDNHIVSEDESKQSQLLNLTPTVNLKTLYEVSPESSDDDEEEEDEEDSDENHIFNENESKQSKNSHKKSGSAIRKSNEKVSETVKVKAKEKKRNLLAEDPEKMNETLKVKGKKKKKNLLAEDPEKMSETVKVKAKEKKRNLLAEDPEKSSEESDDSDSESDDSSGNQSEDFDHKWEELRNEAPDTDEINHRLAVCNMDWDRIRAIDLLVCFNSFKPSDGCINSVKIYPSEYGLKRMEEERLKGPPELVERTLDEELKDKKGSKFHREKLRQYQINRLKYYYAVVDCDSPETANILYEELNGMEYESSSVRFDLRFIPDDMTFDNEPTSTADKLPDPTEYKPNMFVTSALQQVKVDLTWDETDPKRKDFFQKIFTDPDSVQNDIHDFLASASSESEAEENIADEEPNENMNTKDRIAKYKELLLSIEEKERAEEAEKNKYHIEVIWEPLCQKEVEERIQEKIKKANFNPFEEMLHKKKEERKKKKKEQKAVNKQAEDSDGSEKYFGDASTSNEKTEDEKRLAELALISDSKKEMDFQEKSRKSKKNKPRDLDDFVGDPNDPRFAAMYTSSLFNMAPSNPHVKKNEGNFIRKSEKRQFKSKKFHGPYKKRKY